MQLVFYRVISRWCTSGSTWLGRKGSNSLEAMQEEKLMQQRACCVRERQLAHEGCFGMHAGIKAVMEERIPDSAVHGIGFMRTASMRHAWGMACHAPAP
eukprot:353077-Chlamydomonas_euryale.AAC.8